MQLSPSQMQTRPDTDENDQFLSELTTVLEKARRGGVVTYPMMFKSCSGGVALSVTGCECVIES
ncbi:hypothetical protein GQ44DRAFT_708804 [Phaeosphaeriaceae sp. PMI808]|nr:hypothetical protein GQ44DRAFT_708804 [Phaeosphaeriaceae sp. PMI808]